MRCLNIESLLETIRSLPTLPETHLHVMHLAENNATSAAEVARVVGMDAALAARVLRVANTPFYGMNGRIETLSRAVVVLGTKTVCSLALGAAVMDVFEQQDYREECGIDVWKHSLQTAIAARELAEYNGTIDPDLAFTGGLLHDMGKLVFSSFFGEAYRLVLDEHKASCTPLTELEDRMFGINHVDAGAILCGRWKLPHSVRQIVENHHHVCAPSKFGGGTCSISLSDPESESVAVAHGNILARLVTPHASGEIHVSTRELECLFGRRRRSDLYHRLVVSHSMQPPVVLPADACHTEFAAIECNDHNLHEAFSLIALACGYTPTGIVDSEIATLLISESSISSSQLPRIPASEFITTIDDMQYLNVAALHRILLFSVRTRKTINSCVAN